MNNTITKDNVANYILAGKAVVTIRNTKTGGRFTFRIKKHSEKDIWFVAVLTGSDNESDYSYLGTIFNGTKYSHGRKSKISSDAPSAVAFAWFFPRALSALLPTTLEISHSGNCGKCGRTLTTPESLRIGLGPVCAG